MRTFMFAVAALTVLAGPSFADPWKDESGKGRWRAERGGDYRGHFAREYKQEFRQGNCKIERKWKRNGDYKEEIKCKGRR